MCEEIIVRQCAPTLAGIKTGSLFPYPCSSRQEAIADVCSFNRQFLHRGLCLLPLKFRDTSVLLLLFRPDRLAKDLKDPLAAGILAGCGYSCRSYGEYLAALIRRFSECEQFPHEIGLFIGYPPEDVLGFIQNRALNFKCSGLWKVYGDEDHARCLFQQFRQCTESYCCLWQSGLRLEQLAVSA